MGFLLERFRAGGLTEWIFRIKKGLTHKSELHPVK